MRLKSRVVWFWVAGGGGLLLAAAVAGALLISSEGPSLTTDTRSDVFPTGAARVAFLGRYLKMRAPATDAWFHVVYHDNSRGVPGPSDWSIVAAVRVSPADAPAWLAEARPATPEDVARAAAAARPVIPAEWNVTSTGGLYTRQGTILVWHPEGVLELSVSTS